MFKRIILNIYLIFVLPLNLTNIFADSDCDKILNLQQDITKFNTNRYTQRDVLNFITSKDFRSFVENSSINANIVIPLDGVNIPLGFGSSNNSGNTSLSERMSYSTESYINDESHFFYQATSKYIIDGYNECIRIQNIERSEKGKSSGYDLVIEFVQVDQKAKILNLQVKYLPFNSYIFGVIPKYAKIEGIDPSPFLNIKDSKILKKNKKLRAATVYQQFCSYNPYYGTSIKINTNEGSAGVYLKPIPIVTGILHLVINEIYKDNFGQIKDRALELNLEVKFYAGSDVVINLPKPLRYAMLSLDKEGKHTDINLSSEDATGRDFLVKKQWTRGYFADQYVFEIK